MDSDIQEQKSSKLPDKQTVPGKVRIHQYLINSHKTIDNDKTVILRKKTWTNTINK